MVVIAGRDLYRRYRDATTPQQMITLLGEF
jgi:hypothetical protein